MITIKLGVGCFQTFSNSQTKCARSFHVTGTNSLSDLLPLQLLRVAHLGTGRRILYKYRRQVNLFCVLTFFFFFRLGDEGVARELNPDASLNPPTQRLLLVSDVECPLQITGLKISNVRP